MKERIKTYVTERMEEAAVARSEKDKQGLVFENRIGKKISRHTEEKGNDLE